MEYAEKVHVIEFHGLENFIRAESCSHLLALSSSYPADLLDKTGSNFRCVRKQSCCLDLVLRVIVEELAVAGAQFGELIAIGGQGQQSIAAGSHRVLGSYDNSGIGGLAFVKITKLRRRRETERDGADLHVLRCSEGHG